MPESLEWTIDGEITPDHVFGYVHVPFDVPSGIERIDVTYTYDSVIDSDPYLSGGNTLDIGVFDSRGVEFLNAGYRGWSGSERSTFFVARDSATPGYMPGPIQPGTWSVCLGAYKVAPQGCHYHITIRLTPEAISAPVEFPVRLKLADSKTAQPHSEGWYKGELHCHTVNSDGDSTVEEIVRRAEELGLDFLAITDHNNLTHQIDMTRVETDLVLIPGLEVTTFYGHWNIWGDGKWIDFRIQQEDDLARAIIAAKQQGYLVSCNHPRPYGPDWVFRDVRGYDCVEVWNGPWALMNTACRAFWEERLKRGERLSAVGGSDHHFTHTEHIARLGTPTTYIYAPQAPSAADVLDALRAGHAFVTESPEGPQLRISAGGVMMGDTVLQPVTNGNTLDLFVTVIDGAGSRLEIHNAFGLSAYLDINDDRVDIKLPVPVIETPYIRAQLVDPESEHVHALTNPIYIAP